MKDNKKTMKVNCKKCGKPFSTDPENPHDWCRECAEKERERKKVAYRLTCIECGKEFYVTAGEAKYMKEKGYDIPKRCYECRQMRKIEKAKAAQQVEQGVEE